MAKWKLNNGLFSPHFEGEGTLAQPLEWVRSVGMATLFLAVLMVLMGFMGDGAAAADNLLGVVPHPHGLVSGTVKGEAGAPIAGATVGWQGTEKRTLSDETGSFTLSELPVDTPLNISAWKEGSYCALLREVSAPASGVEFRLISIQTTDNAAYQWLPPTLPGDKGSCAECHDPTLIDMSLADAHLKSAQNPRFLTMYLGTDTEGNQSPPVRYGPGSGAWTAMTIPLAPDPSEPYFGPGFVLDDPQNPGTCSACHLPGASIAGDVNPTTATGADRHGVHCDFCHKVAAVRLKADETPFYGLPGVHSMQVRRPFPEDPLRFQLFFGTFDDDNVPAEDTRLPLLSESRFCAPCHSGILWSTVIYDSYGEWLRSPYSDPNSGKARTCQECHMPSPAVWKGKTLTNVAPGKGGIDRAPTALHSHFMTVDENLLRNALTLTTSAKAAAGKIVVEVTLTNDKTGHHVPSDCPLRHMILLVDVRDEAGASLKQKDGPVLPAWCGVGDPAGGYLAKLPGKAYAKILSDRWTNEVPVTAYWRDTALLVDNRLGAFQSDTSTYAFLPSKPGKVEVKVTLLYRRAFKTLMDQKKWVAPDIVMAEEKLVVEAGREEGS